VIEASDGRRLTNGTEVFVPGPASELQVFPGQHNLEASMIRNGNCHDEAFGAPLVRAQLRGAVAGSIIQLRKQERIGRRT
jgi:hypothetical protein